MKDDFLYRMQQMKAEKEYLVNITVRYSFVVDAQDVDDAFNRLDEVHLPDFEEDRDIVIERN